MSADAQRANADERRKMSSIRCRGPRNEDLPCYGPVEIEDNGLWSSFHSLQVSINRKFSRGVTFLGSYVWSKYLDIHSFEGHGNSGPRNPFNLFLDKGLSDNDVAHRFVISYIWELPRVRRFAGLSNKLLNGWQINGITTAQSGTPYTIFSGRDTSLTTVGKDTADPVPGQDPAISGDRPRGDTIGRYFNTAAFQTAADGTVGQVGRNSLRGPAYVNWDFALFKDFPLSERWGKIQFRNEYFNIFNQVNFRNPVNSIASGAAFGKILATRDPRFIQFGLKWIF